MVPRAYQCANYERLIIKNFSAQPNQYQECVKSICIDEVIQSLAAKLNIAHKPNT